jgi:DNA repair protein RecO (recombination protein O)
MHESLLTSHFSPITSASMSAETLSAILLRRIRFSETSLILTWFSQEAGKIKAIAKGALRSSSAFAGKLDLFFLCELTIARSSKSEIHTLREVVVSEPFLGIRSNYLNTLAGSYFVELIEETTELEHAEPEIFDLLRRALGFLECEQPSVRAMTFFEAQLAKALGIHAAKESDASRNLLESLSRTPRTRAALLKELKA